MRHAWILSGGLLGAVALVACSAPESSSRWAAPAVAPPASAALPPTGQLFVQVVWPRRVQVIPYSTNLIDLSIRDSLGNEVASTSISQSTGQTTSQATLTILAGNITVDANAYATSTLVATGSATASVPINRQATASLTLTPLYVPTISSFQPNAGPGALITITGSNFGASGVPLSVAFAGITSPTCVASDSSELTAEVPSGFASGSIVVTANGVPSATSSAFSLLTQLSAVSMPDATLSVNQTLSLSVAASDSAGAVSDPYVTWEVLSGSNVYDKPGGTFSAATGSATVFTASATGSGILEAQSGSLIATASLVVQ